MSKIECKIELKKENVEAAYKVADENVKKVLNALFGEKRPAPTLDDYTTIQSYEDACTVLGIEPINEEVLTKSGFTKDEIAYRKLKTISRALNGGWEPDWTNGNEYKYWPWFVYNPKPAGFGCAHTHYPATTTSTSIGSRLCFKTRELAAFAGETFEDLYNEFFLIK